MALTQCKECQGTVSDHAAACPHCGAPAAAQTVARPALSGMGRMLAVLCAVVAAVWAFVLISATTIQVNGSYALSPAYASRAYSQATMGLASLSAVMLAVIMLVYSAQRSQ